jgi:hypothetical protein
MRNICRLVQTHNHLEIGLQWQSHSVSCLRISFDVFTDRDKMYRAPQVVAFAVRCIATAGVDCSCVEVPLRHHALAAPASTRHHGFWSHIHCGCCLSVSTSPCRYCSKACQEKQWRQHKPECRRIAAAAKAAAAPAAAVQ